MKKIRFFYEWDYHFFMKTFRIMRITVFLLLVSILQTFANDAYSQKTRLSLDFSKTKLVDVLDEIENKTEFYFLFNEKLIDTDRNVNMSVKNEKIDEILDQLFAGTDVVYTVTDRKIILAPSFLSENEQQQNTITGKVTDEIGQPLPGVTVIIKGTTQGTVTSADGNYSLTNIPEDATLVFSFVGMLTQEVVVGSQTNINVRMEENAIGIEEVVAIGYGTMRKSDLTGSVGSVSSDKLVEQPSVSPVEALAGKVAGVSVFNGSGRPGGDFRVKIRGMRSINASNNPLYVIDGIVGGDINLINTNDIETINVLKDASATAIYGAQAANGVVIVTTKRAEKGKIQLTYDGSMSIANQANKIDLLNAEEYMEMRGRIYDDIRKYRPLEADNLVDYSSDFPQLFNSDGSPKYDTDWQDETFGTAISHRHYLSVSGATDKFSSSLSFGYQDEEGIMLTTFLEKTTAKYSGEYKMNKWLKFGGVLMYGHTYENKLDDALVNSMTPTRAAIETPPIFPVTYPDGTYSKMEDIHRKNGAMDSWKGGNPVAILNRFERYRKRYQFLSNMYAELQLSKDMKFRSSYGFQKNITVNTNYQTKNFNTTFNKNKAEINQNYGDNWQFENQLTFKKYINNHHFDVMAGASWYSYSYFNFGSSASNFPDEFHKVYNLAIGADPAGVSSNFTESRMNSYFARVNYNYKDKYLATVTTRSDGSSRFGANNRYAFFPSFALAWRISEEGILTENNTITNLKLRTSYGNTGNNSIGDYESLGSPGKQLVIFDKEKANGSTQGVMPNHDLRWEKTSEINIGVDLQLFSRITLMADYYKRETNDLLYGMPVSRVTGFSNALTNIGSTQSQGLELTMESQNLKKYDFKWNTTLVFTTNSSTIKSLATDNADLFINAPGWWNSHIMRVGEETASFWGYTRLGTWGTAEADEAAKYNLVPGDIKLEDVNKDYIYNKKDQKIIGNAFPDYEMNINNSFFYKNWDLSFDVQISQGADIADASIIMISDRYNYGNTYTKFYNQAWTPENQNTMRPRIRTDLNRFDSLDTGMLFDGSFIRGRNLVLGYSVPEGFLKKFSISQLRLSASAQNFFIITDYHGFDPEIATYDGQFSQGLEMYGHPKAKTINFGLKVTF